MFVLCSSYMVKQHRVNLFQTKLNDSIEHCKNKAINKLLTENISSKQKL